ncbi:hypothetical protein [Thiovibrio frasassiensis]|uniref:Uncharacterized protein n=1 Tax=Thiovibrio frasassiensis TaxID=2984131 RepID=A0A9X4MCQ5_9BACT|nr:hypothetical protein [Thiovibrio frasassiensis]MDG4475169.1 hypothetical protein [Thiovibrio frasassiensis]
MRFIVPAIALLVLLSGCTSSSSAYKESFSEVHVSSDLKKILVIGTDKYSYEFDVPAPLSQMINSPLKKGLSFLFQNDGAIAFEVKKDGTILGSFSVVLPDSFFQDHESMKQVAESIGFSHGHIYSLKGRMQVVRDGMPIPRYVAWSDADAEKYTKKLGGVFFLPLSIAGRRFDDKKPVAMQGADFQKLDQRYTVVVVDGQTTKVDLLGPTAAIVGGATCAAAWPICLAAALPMMGMKP